MQETMISYIRDEDRNPYGCLAGKLVGSKVLIGVSVCHTGVDTFNKVLGRQIAEGRIAMGRSSAVRHADLTDAISLQVDQFKWRCQKFFRTENVEVVGL